MEEIWKPIAGYEGYYEVSNLGRVKSVERHVKQGNSTRYVKEKIKSQHLMTSGYPSVALYKNRKEKIIPIHILVARAFIPNPENKPNVDHINTDKTDYRIENLRWVTPKENSNNELTLQHCRENTYSKESLRKRLETRKAGNTATAPKTVFQYTKEGVFIKEFYSMQEAEKEIGVNHNSIRRALNDYTQSAGGYLWTSVYTENMSYSRRKSPLARAVVQYDKDDNLINEWDSLNEASIALGMPRANILRSIKSTAKPRKYKFRYKEESA